MKFYRAIYKTGSNVTIGGVSSKEKEGQFVPILDVVTLEMWYCPESNLIVSDNFDTEKDVFQRQCFEQGSGGSMYAPGWIELFLDKDFQEIEDKHLFAGDYHKNRLESLKAALHKKLNPPKEEVKRPRKKVTRKKRK